MAASFSTILKCRIKNIDEKIEELTQQHLMGYPKLMAEQDKYRELLRKREEKKKKK